MAKEIIWKPLPKQAEFLAATEDEVLYGGAAGSGKSDAMIIAALGLNQYVPAITLSRYTALIIRKTYKELSDLIRRTQEVYRRIDKKAQFNISTNTWTFGSGAKIIFGNCDNDSSVLRYQGSEYQFIGIEELGQWETDYAYHYLRSRLRSSDPKLRCFMRATANPSKYKWIREYFQIDSIGSSCKRIINIETVNSGTQTRKIRFISAKLLDNPYLANDGKYEAMLISLPEEERNALLYGRWDSYNIKGSIYSDLLADMRKDGRVCRVKYDQNLPVFCFFDLGWNDSTAIIITQFLGKETRIIDHIEDTNQPFSYYCNLITSKYQSKNGLKIILPHDAKSHSIQTGNTIESLAITAFGSDNVEVIPRDSIEVGIKATKEMIRNLYIETSLDRLLECMENYRRKYDSALQTYTEPIHDQYSNTADALRYVAMYSNDKKIIQKPLSVPLLRPRNQNMTPW